MFKARIQWTKQNYLLVRLAEKTQNLIVYLFLRRFRAAPCPSEWTSCVALVTYMIMRRQSLHKISVYVRTQQRIVWRRCVGYVCARWT